VDRCCLVRTDFDLNDVLGRTATLHPVRLDLIEVCLPRIQLRRDILPLSALAGHGLAVEPQLSIGRKSDVEARSVFGVSLCRMVDGLIRVRRRRGWSYVMRVVVVVARAQAKAVEGGLGFGRAVFASIVIDVAGV